MSTSPTRQVPAGTFVQGDDHGYPEEAPSRTVAVAAFEIDVHPVTNAQFADFVAATGHVTGAESTGAAVFVAPAGAVDLGQPALWWQHRRTASWRRPNGVDPLSAEHDDHPVVGVTVADAAAYAAWVGGRLPTETEWEWAAGGGIALAPTWPLAADGMLLANVWLGEFPWRSIRAAAPGTMPVGSFPPNVFGLFDMLGNAWELTSDRWTVDHRRPARCCSGSALHETTAAVVAKGGSFLCAANYCRRYRPPARHFQGAGEAAGHVGFRCVYEPGRASPRG